VVFAQTRKVTIELLNTLLVSLDTFSLQSIIQLLMFEVSAYSSINDMIEVKNRSHKKLNWTRVSFDC
jgi:hypothetical protein